MASKILAFDNNSALSNTDDARLSRIEAALPISRAGQVIYSNSALAVPAISAVLASGQISPSSGVQNTGNAFAFVVQGQFGFAWNGSGLTIYWDGTNGSIPFVVRRADATQISIPRGSISISGLDASTLYSFAPFVAVAQPQRVSFVVGDSGSPRYAFSPSISQSQLAMAAQTQRLTVNEAITNGLIQFTTGAGSVPSSGGGSSSGGRSPYVGQYTNQDVPA